ncbi:MAG: geranylgeranylglycerol-phosphate geranylgeranyltransferase [Crocinitomicaceae bacterium]|nr:geranylgeranylglycerol-phosphate geranylgeranyltransferase [Crocinitomicaceae bacterium]
MGFFRLIRINNLFIIVITLTGVWYGAVHSLRINSSFISYLLMILFTILIAGAGNAINDYFDVKADRINRPKRQVIEKTIKKRWAIIIHWGFNLIALVISIYLSIHLHSWFYVFIHLFATTLLWVYSIFLKRVYFISNLSISVLVALVPVLGYKTMLDLNLIILDMRFPILLTLGAFVTNLTREIIKDVQDMEGDQKTHVKSIAVVSGKKVARRWAMSIQFLLVPLIVVSYFLMKTNRFSISEMTYYTSLGFGLIAFLSILFGIKESWVSMLLKASMIIGTLTFFTL